MLEVLFSEEKAINAVKVIPMIEGKSVKTDCLTKNEANLVKKAIIQSGFNGNKKEFTEIFAEKNKIILVGLGSAEDDLIIQEVGAALFNKLFFNEVAYIVAENDFIALNLAFGILLESYSFDKYKTCKKAEEYPVLEKVVFGVDAAKDVQERFKPYVALITGIRYCKDLCNEPANYLTPQVFASDIKRLEYLGLDVEILGIEDIRLKGLGLIEAVSQGSDKEPKVAIVSWKGNRGQETYDLAMIGKGVCFDSGGLNVKSNVGMIEMKMDMAGAATVISVMKAASLQRIRKNLIAVVGLVENMSGCGAMKIGDIYSSVVGKTVEIMNTDAEGRLIIADCLGYLQQNYKFKKVITIATLGSLKNILGNIYAGLFSNDEKLAQNLIKSGAVCGEKLWKMPLDKEYEKMLESKLADMRNVEINGRVAVVSAAFLQQFVENGIKWAHIDMSGCRIDKKGLASGFGVRLLNEFIKGL